MPQSTRRAFLADLGMGFTGLALGALLARDGVVRADAPVGLVAAGWQAAFPAEGQERHLALHGRRRQPRRELRPEAGPEPIRRQDDRRDAVQGRPRFAAPEKEPARVHSRPAQGPAEDLPACRSAPRSAASAAPRSATGGRTSASLCRRPRRRPLDVDDRQRPRRPAPVPHRPARPRRAVSRRSARGFITGSARSTRTCRSSSSSASRWPTAAAG